MRKRVVGRKFKRTANQRKALLKSLVHSMILVGRIKTTEAKAKAIKAKVEKLVTKARNKGEEARNDLLRDLANHDIVEKLISNIAPRFKERTGGYTRILRLGRRVKDNSPMVLLEWVESEIIIGESVVNTSSKKDKKEKKKKSKEAKKASKEVKTQENTKKNK